MQARCVSAATRGVQLTALLAVVLSAPVVSAQNKSRIDADLAKVEREVAALAATTLKRDTMRSPTHVEERLTDGELFYRLEDFTRAAIIFTDIVDHYPNHRAFPDALYLLADSLYLAGDIVGARRRFEQVLQQATTQAAYRPYAQRSLGRLIEIAIRTRNFEGVDQYFGQLNQLAPREVEAATTYYRGKYLFNRAVSVEDATRDRKPTDPEPAMDLAMLEQAKQTFEGVQEGSPYFPQARYFVAVIHVLRREFPQAVTAFMRVLKAPSATAEHQRVNDLARLGVGRLYYELDQLDAAVKAYQSVSRTSPYFDIALFEAAWVFIRQGEALKAERALEVLAIASPDSRFIADGELLRGNLLLRSGKHDEAENVFRSVRKRFGPIQRELEDMVKDHDDPVAHFRLLVRENMDDFDPNAFLPERARRWSEADADMDRALLVLSDLSWSRRTTEEIADLIERLNAALSPSAKHHAFADLRREREKSVALQNRLAALRQALLAKEAAGGGNAELDQIRSQRRAIEAAIGKMPRSDEDFVLRNEQLLGRYRAVEKDMSALAVEVLGIEARLTAFDRYLAEAENVKDKDALKNELELQRAAVKSFREELKQYRRLGELSRLQVGVGDSRYQRDDKTRAEYNSLVERERQLMAQLGLRRDASIDAAFDRIARLDAQLRQRDAAVDAVVEERVAAMRVVIDEETVKLDGYRTGLEGFVNETEEVVGGVTYANFEQIRKRFYDLVLRADVGRIDVAWAKREEHRMRVDALTRERSAEMQSVDDEYREITDTDTGAQEGEEP